MKGEALGTPSGPARDLGSCVGIAFTKAGLRSLFCSLYSLLSTVHVEGIMRGGSGEQGGHRVEGDLRGCRLNPSPVYVYFGVLTWKELKATKSTPQALIYRMTERTTCHETPQMT